MTTKTALVTGASRGLGRALTAALTERGWQVVGTGRDRAKLAVAVAEFRGPGAAIPVSGDVADPRHRQELAARVAEFGGLDLLVNNASILGPSPQPGLAGYPLEILERVFATNTLAPIALFQLVATYLEGRGGRVVNVTSDAAVEPYPGWGGYGSSKAALDQASNILAAEHPALRIYSFDPGDMATDLHQQAFPGEDISDRPAPEAVVPSLLRLVDGDLQSGRYRAADLVVEAVS